MIELVDRVSVNLVQTNATDDLVALAAWVSHDAADEARLDDRDRVAGLIDFLWRERHTSPMEHGSWTFRVDVPIFVAREWQRHRTQSINEVSGRYTELQPRFYVGAVAREQQGKPGDYYFTEGTPEQTAIYLQTKRKACEYAWNVYQQRLEAGIAKEQAREDLPLSIMTQYYSTMNTRNMMHFLELRSDEHALEEIRDAAVQVEQIFKENMPLTYRAYQRAQNRVTIDLNLSRDSIIEQLDAIRVLINTERSSNA